MDIKTIGAVLLVGALALGGAYWYVRSHPAPVHDFGTTATSTPTGASGSPLGITENATYYTVTAEYPGSTPLAAGNTEAVAAMKQFELAAIAQFKKDGNFANLSHDDVQILGLDQRKMSLDITYRPAVGAHTVSYIFSSILDTFGAHPNTFFHTFTFDTTTGASLSLSDIFVPGADYASLLSSTSRKLLPQAIAKKTGVSKSDIDTAMLTAGTTAVPENFRNWYIEGKNLVIIFEPYQVAAYAAGSQTISIPFSDLGTSIRTQYH
jgi:hypothetical protein